MTYEQQGELLDRISTGRCPYPNCGSRGSVEQRLTYVVNTLTLGLALLLGATRSVTLDVRVCRFHSGK